MYYVRKKKKKKKKKKEEEEEERCLHVVVHMQGEGGNYLNIVAQINNTYPPKFHETYIMLIPKTKDLVRVTDYRPISLCNVAYKLASRVVANRMKVVLQEVMCENQSAFLAERLITNNILVAHEVMNHIGKRKKGKSGEMALKLDMSKAYDRVEWECLK